MGKHSEPLNAVGQERGQTVDQVATDMFRRGLPEVTENRPRRRLAFASVGASDSPRGATEADQLLAEGFGRDETCSS